jgi:preprotein translocase subunit SecF
VEFFKQNTRIDFMALRFWAGGLSLVTFIAAIVILSINGLNWGLEFTGGVQLQLHFPSTANPGVIRDRIHELGFQDVVVQTYGQPNDVMVRMHSSDEEKEKTASHDVLKLFPEAKLQGVSFIGAQVGKELATDGALALFVALLGTVIYIAVRFEYRFSVSAAAALIHDPVIILGVFSLLHMEFDLITLAAILTIIGYSLNDTIVVFDRMRENFRKNRKLDPSEIVNLSVNQTLSRTIMTSGLTLVAVVSLFLFGGEVLHGFATALIIGIVVGTYSSIYVAGAFAVMLGLSRKDLIPAANDGMDQHP